MKDRSLLLASVRQEESPEHKPRNKNKLRCKGEHIDIYLDERNLTGNELKFEDDPIVIKKLL